MSSLNPNAPLFYPSWFNQMEDFSPEWWHLVKNNASFREFWIRERCHLDDEEDNFQDVFLDEEDFDELEDVGGGDGRQDGKSSGCIEKTRRVTASDLMGQGKSSQLAAPSAGCVFVSARDKFAQVPPKMAAQMKNNASAAHQRIQQPR